MLQVARVIPCWLNYLSTAEKKSVHFNSYLNQVAFMKEKVLVISDISDIVYACPKCSKMSLVKIGPDLYQCVDCKSQKEQTSETHNNFPGFVLGLMGWLMLLLLP